MEYWNAPATQPAPPQIDIAAGAVYREKKRLADALRKKAEREHTPVSGLIQSEGANGSPGYTQVDYAGILNNFMQPGFQKAREEKAAAAESDADAARSAALDQLLGRQGLTAADAIRAKSDLGVDVSSAVKDPAAEKLALTRMIAQNPALAYMLPQEERDAFTAYSSKLSDTERTADREDFKWKQDNTYRAPNNSRTFEQDMELARLRAGGGKESPTVAEDGRTPFAQLSAGAQNQGLKLAAELNKEYNFLDGQRSEAANIRAIIDDPKNFGTVPQMVDALSESGGYAGALGKSFMSPAAAELNRFFGSETLISAGKLGGAESDRDVAMLKSFNPSMAYDHDAVKRMWGAYERIMDRAEAAKARRLNDALNPRTGIRAESPTATPTAPPTVGGETIQQRIARLKGAKYWHLLRSLTSSSSRALLPA